MKWTFPTSMTRPMVARTAAVRASSTCAFRNTPALTQRAGAIFASAAVTGAVRKTPREAIMSYLQITDEMVEAALKAEEEYHASNDISYTSEGMRRALSAAIAAMPQEPVAWRTMDSAPKGHPSMDVGCRDVSEWFLGKPADKYRGVGVSPFVVIRRRARPSTPRGGSLLGNRRRRARRTDHSGSKPGGIGFQVDLGPRHNEQRHHGG